MKKLFIIIIIGVLLAGCGKDKTIKNGTYYQDGDKIKAQISFDTDKKEWVSVGSIYMSACVTGTYEIKGNKLMAKSEDTTVTFEIISETKLKCIKYEGDFAGWFADKPTFIHFSVK